MRLTMQKTSTPLRAAAMTAGKGRKHSSRGLCSRVALATLALAGFAGGANAADVYLQAQSFDKDVAGEMVPMWGFASCTDGTYTSCGTPTAPGPQINLSSTDSLTIHLDNTLGSPVSIVIPGLPGGGDPVKVGGRVQSLTQEAVSGGTQTYTWNSLRAGSYIYQSGTQQPLQVPMGLYGALIVHSDAADASYAETVIADGPTSYYRLGETGGTTAADATGAMDGTYGATVEQGLLLDLSSDTAAGFDGVTATDFVDTGVTSLSDSAFSVEAWVNADDTTVQRRIVVKDEIGVTGAWLLWFNQGKLRFQVRNAGNTAWVIAEAPVTPAAGTTFHVVGVFDNGAMSLYVDGESVATAALGTATTNTNSLPIVIGADSDPVGARGHLFDGTIDEVAIYDGVALDPAQIQAHYAANSVEPVLLFSEIDPLQNQRVADAAAMFGTPTESCVSLADYVDSMSTLTGYPCTIDYNPAFMLTNGEVSPGALPAGAPGKRVMLRLLNAGLRSHTPSVVGLDMALIAENGNAYPGLPRQQSHALLPAGGTIDALIGVNMDDGLGGTVFGMPGIDARYALFDRMPDLVNDTLPATVSTVASLEVGDPPAPGTPPAAVELSYNVTEDTTLAFNPPGGGGTQVVSRPTNGDLVESDPAGSFAYTPNLDFSGSDYFTYFVTGTQTTYHVTFNVSFENDAPVAVDDGPYVNTIGSSIAVAAPGLLGNDRDADGDALTAVIDGAAPVGLTLNADGSFTYTGPATTFDYTASDGVLTSAPVTVTLNSNPVAGIALTVQEPDGTPVEDYRWTVEEENLWHPDLSGTTPTSGIQATNFHKSYMPVVAQGNGAAEFAQLALDPAKHYYVSVLPADAYTGTGHTIGGARIPPAASAVTVNVNKQPLVPAQISILVFEDNSPTNGSPDGAELANGLGGFQVTLEDAGGRYGISAGVMLQDQEGNLLENSLDCFGGAAPPPGVILTCPDTQANRNAGLVGQALIQNLFPGKYGIIVTAPSDGQTWTQTSTIEGTKVIDAWVKSGEPPFFQEFGPGVWHAFVGFVNPANLSLPAGGSNTVTGKVTNLHLARPPAAVLADSGSFAAMAHTRAWVGLNSAGGIGPNIAAVQADEDGNFSIPNVPDGNYQLVVWDSYLDLIIAFRGVTLPGGGDVQNVPVFQWFARSEHNVFLDDGCGDPSSLGFQDGIRQDCEAPLSEQAVNLRWRDGTVNQSFPTDLEGFVPFDQTFPFFHWQVLEVDYTRFKATGLTTTVDAGGVITSPYSPGVLEPQIQTEDCTTPDCISRTETGQILTQGFQGFAGQTSVFDWGKAPYAPGENGGISGIVYYPSTRAENEPRLAAAEPWEPGIPGVTLRLYREVQTTEGGTSLALVAETTTDSWDESLPEGCPGATIPEDTVITGPGNPTKCYDGLRNFNQARPAVFDGGYAFNDIPAGKYVVEVVPPSGYDLMKEEDNNVGFGDVFAYPPVMTPMGLLAIPDGAMVLAAQGAEPGIAQPPCVGALREVPQHLSLFPDAEEAAPFAGALRPLCDRKEVILSDQGQAAADFFLLTQAPIAGHFAGVVLDDVAQEFSVTSPQFGEKWAPPFVPVSFKDHNGVEISRIYTDEYGRMNGLVPSTFTANMPSPSGFSPAMYISCMNDPGPILDTEAGSPTFGQMIQDPNFNPGYSNFCYTFQYMPGTTTYLDTPVLPVSAFASGDNPVDCAFDDSTPMIASVGHWRAPGTDLDGPWFRTDNTLGNRRIEIRSVGLDVEVPNPAYEGPLAVLDAGQKTITRDFDFGTTPGTVYIGDTQLTIDDWNENRIRATIAENAVLEGELVVTRGDNGRSTTNAVTVSAHPVTPATPGPVRVGPTRNFTTIQAGIDAAGPGRLVLVDPGTYDELVIMWKPVRLQGSGAGSTIINAVKVPTEKIAGWREMMDQRFLNAHTLPTQPNGSGGFTSEEGSAITVFGRSNSAHPQSFANNPSRIDGFSITGGSVGGGIFVNGYAHGLEIANNRVFGNSGIYAGGVRIGRPFLQVDDGDLNDADLFGFNTNVKLHHNAITQNGGQLGAGGGLSIATGTDGYSVSDNFVCGNFTTADGAGIAHLGLSDGGLIKGNRIVLNQSFLQTTTASGGGLFIGGVPPLVDGITFGTGSVTVDSNLIQGNQAGSGHGGGIRTQFVNGRDIVNATNNGGNSPPGQWYRVDIVNNMIVNNVAGWSGGGISLQDTARSFIINNTIAHNDSTATVSAAFTTGDPNVSAPQPAGLSSEPHSAALSAVIPVRNNTNNYRDFSNPRLHNNILWQNRSFHYATPATIGGSGLVPELVQASVGECVTGATYDDLGVLGGGFALNPTRSVLTDNTGYPGNTTGDPGLVNAHCNGGRYLAEFSPPGPMLALPALDEGGAAWIDVRYGPLTLTWPAGGLPWDYHIGTPSSAIDWGRANGDTPSLDFDGDSRPLGDDLDAGADELQ